MIQFLSFLLIFASQGSENCSKTQTYEIFAQETLETVLSSASILDKQLHKLPFKFFFNQNISLANLDLVGHVFITISQFYSDNFSQISILTKSSDSTYFISKFKNEKFIFKNSNFQFQEKITMLQSIQMLEFSCTNMQQSTKYYIVTQCYSNQFHNFVVLDDQNNLNHIYIHKNISDQQLAFTQFDQKLYFIFQDSIIRKIFIINFNQYQDKKEFYYYNINEIEVFFDLNEQEILQNRGIEKILDVTLTDQKYLLAYISTNLNLEFMIKFDLQEKHSFQLQDNFYIDHQKQLKGIAIRDPNFCLQYNSSDFIFNFQAKFFLYIVFQQNRVIYCDQEARLLVEDLNLVFNYNVQKLLFDPNGFVILNSTNLIYLTIQEQNQLPIFQPEENLQEKTLVVQQQKLCLQFKLISEMQNTLKTMQFGRLEIKKMGFEENEKNKISLDFQYRKNFTGYPFTIESVEIENNKYYYELQKELSCPALGKSLNNSILIIAKLQAQVATYFILLDNQNQLVIKFCEHFITQKIKLQEQIKREQICSTSNFVYVFIKNYVLQIQIKNFTIEYQKIFFQEQIIFLACLQSSVVLQLQNFSLYKIELFQQIEKLQIMINDKVSSLEIQTNKSYIIIKQTLYIYQNNKIIEEFDEYKYHSIYKSLHNRYILFVQDKKNSNYILVNYKQTSQNFRRERVLPMYNFTADKNFQIALYSNLLLINRAGLQQYLQCQPTGEIQIFLCIIDQILNK